MVNEAKRYLEQFVSLLPGHKFQQMLELGGASIPGLFTVDEQKQIDELLSCVRPEKQQCFANCQKAILRYGAPFQYVEGFYASHKVGIATEHAWLTLNGKLVEITPGLTTGDYFGVTIDPQLLMEFLTETKNHGPITDDYQTGWKYTKQVLNLNLST